MAKKPKAFNRVDVVLRPCSPQLAREHLMALGRAFLEESYVERWEHITIEKPEKGRLDGLQKFENHLNKKFCKKIEGGDIFPDSLAEHYGPVQGVYFDLKGQPYLMTAAEAASYVSFEAVLSLIPGKLAIFFTHNRYARLCERK